MECLHCVMHGVAEVKSKILAATWESPSMKKYVVSIFIVGLLEGFKNQYPRETKELSV
jgi:hypothetical protein